MRPPLISRPPQGSQLDRGHPLSKGLVAGWLSNERAGHVLTDYSGYRRNVTLSSDVRWFRGGMDCWDLNSGAYLVDDAFVGTQYTIVLSLWAYVVPETGTGTGPIGSYPVGYTYQFNWLHPSNDWYKAWGYRTAAGTWVPLQYTTTLQARTQYCCAFSMDNGIGKIYLDGSLERTVFNAAPGITDTGIVLGAKDGGLYTNFNGIIYHVYFYDRVLTDIEVAQISVSPYQIFSNPGAYVPEISTILPINCNVSDGFSMSDAAGKQAIFSAMAHESMALADTDQNIGNFIAALVDQIAMSATTGRAATLNVESQDAVGFSGAVSSVQKILALVTDGIQVAESPVGRADLTGSAQDEVQFSESIVATLHATAVINEIVNLSDSVSPDTLSVISALAADVFSVADGPAVRADLVMAILDNFSLSDAAINFMTALATVSEAVSLTDAVFWQGIQSAFAADGLSVNDQAMGIMTALATAADSIQLDDSGTVTATFGVEVHDAVQFAETIAAIAAFRASVADGIRITATPMEISTLPNGKVSVSFSLKTPGAEFEMKTATIVFNLK